MKIYLVGGAVRDKLLGKEPRDKDFVVIGSDEEMFLKKFPKAKKVGKKIPVYIYKGKEYTLSPFKTIEEDLWDRDLTINALAMDEDGKIYSLPTTLEDIKKKILRPVREENFLKDPLRIYRVARFLSQMPEYSIHQDLLKIISRVGQDKDLLKKISPERVCGELTKALEGKKPGNFLKLLGETFSFTYWFEEFDRFKNTNNSLNHIIEVMNKTSGYPCSVWMGMCHLLTLDELKKFSKRLKLPNRLKDTGIITIIWHKKAKDYPNMKSTEKVELLELLDRKKIFKEFFFFLFADSSKDFYPQAEKDLTKIKEVHLPKEYWGKGKLSGEILKSLKAKRLEEGVR